MVVELARDLIRTQDQLGPRDTTNLVFKLFNEQAPTMYVTTQVRQQSIGHAFILGHETNGKLGIANGVDGQQITLGDSGLGTSTVVRVVSTNNTFVEALRDTTYVDTDNTTATVDTTNFTIQF